MYFFLFPGSGGTGKSYLINVFTQWCQKILTKPGDNPDQPKILLMAFTGIAASQIGGCTLHTALGLKFGTECLPLGDEQRAKLRKRYEHLKVVIIDELSMISSDVLYNINKRLQEIMGCLDPFGNIAIVLFGDVLQLPPVKACQIFLSPSYRNVHHRALFQSEENLWNNFEVICLIKQKH